MEIGQVTEEILEVARVALPAGDLDIDSGCAIAVVADEPRSAEELLALSRAYQDPQHLERLAHRLGLDIALRICPTVAGTACGDFAEVLSLPDGRVGIVLGDSNGHNDPYAWENAIRLVEFFQSQLFRDYLVGDGGAKIDASGVLNFVDQNCLLCGADAARDAAAVSVLLLDPKTGDFEFANAGNFPIAVVLGSDGRAMVHQAYGRWIGYRDLPVSDGHVRESVVGRLLPGETLVFMTDGVAEGRHSSGKFFHEEIGKLLGELASASSEPKAVLGTIQSQLVTTHDDHAIVACRRLAG